MANTTQKCKAKSMYKQQTKIKEKRSVIQAGLCSSHEHKPAEGPKTIFIEYPSYSVLVYIYFIS